ncbi:MAG: LapA family protein [Chitinophagales bacterium]|nr:LapA family protein [Chitinophagales bacterium]MDW8393546.1 LapA family protein [Chitinophagales bacterium]
MRLNYLFTIIFLLLALIFAIQNTDVISLHFLIWQFSGSQALIVVLIFLLGYVSGWLLQWPRIWRRNSEIRNLRKTQSSTLESAPSESSAENPKS